MSTINTVIAKVNDIKLNDYNAEIKASWIIELDGRIYREIHNMHGNQPPLEYPRDGDKELLVKAPYDNIYELYLFAMIDFNNREIVNYNNSVELFNTAYAEYGRFYQRELANPGRMQFDTMGFIKCNERNSVENKYADEKIKVHNDNISSHAPIREMIARIYSMCTEKIAELSDALSGKLSKSNLLEHDTDASAHSEIIRGIRNDINGHRMRFDNDEADISKNAADIAVITSAIQTLGTSVSKKVDKAEGKGLSSNDYTDTDKASLARLNQHAGDKTNPHNVTKAQLGLDKVDNTPDADKRVAYASDAGYAEHAYIAECDTDGFPILYTYERKEPVLTNLQTSAQLGEELISSSGWTSDGWTGSLADGFTHTVGNTTALEFDMASIAPAGKWYQVEFSCDTAIDTKNLQFSLGGSPVFELYGQIGVDTPAGFGVYASDNSALKFIPTSDFSGKIYDISVKEIISGIMPCKVITVDGNNAYEMRVSPSGTSNIIPQKNIFIGLNSGKNTTSANGIVAIGNNALRDNTSGFWNVAIGDEALEDNSVGSRNIAIGHIALRNNTTGHRNVAIGTFALNHNTEGHHNVAIGSDCLDNNTTGYNNVGIGFANLYRLTTGYENTAIGYQAGTSMSTAFQNVAIGGQCLRNATWAQLNTAMGYNALYAITGGSWNIGIGANAGKTPTSAKRCTFIGYDTDGTKSDVQNSTAIGNGAIVSKDNQVVIGNDAVVETVLKGNVIIRDTDGAEHQVNSLFAQMGDISTALDSIIALQNSYIGGASA